MRSGSAVELNDRAEDQGGDGGGGGGGGRGTGVGPGVGEVKGAGVDAGDGTGVDRGVEQKLGPVQVRLERTVSGIVSLMRERGELERRTTEELERLRGEAERRFDRSTVVAQRERDNRLARAREAEKRDRGGVESRLGGSIREVEGKLAKALSELDAAASEKRERIEKEHSEASWLCETVAESDLKQAEARRTALEERAGVRFRELDGLRERAVAVGEDLLLRGVGDALDEARAEAAGGAAPEPPSDEEIDGADEEVAKPRAEHRSLDATPRPRGPRTAADRLLLLAVSERKRAEGLVERMGSSVPAKVSRGAGFWVLAVALVLVGAGGGFAAEGFAGWVLVVVGAVVGAGLAVGVRMGIGGVADRRGRVVAEEIGSALGRAGRAVEAAREEAVRERAATEERVRRGKDQELASLSEQRERRLARLEESVSSRRLKIEMPMRDRLSELSAERERLLGEVRSRFEAAEREALEGFEEQTVEARRERDEALSAAERAYEEERSSFAERWSREARELSAEAGSLEAMGREHAAPWGDGVWDGWVPGEDRPEAAAVAAMGMELSELEGGDVGSDAFAWPGGASGYRLPMPLEMPTLGSLFIEAGGADREAGIRLAQNAVLRLLTAYPPGKVRFTFVDPVGLGQSFAAFMHLADHEEQLVGGRIWTEPRHIEQRLLDLTEHMENVIQKYLRNEFPTIEAYNDRAGEIAEPYRVLVMADFPANISETAARRLASIASSGARCGVHMVIVADPDERVAKGVSVEDLKAPAMVVRRSGEGGGFRVAREALAERVLSETDPPEDALLTRLVNAVGERATDATRVQVPFEAVAPSEGERWSLSSADGVSVPLGRSGATRLQHLSLGSGTLQHALIAGKTGSGKSTLFHVLITSAALWYSPEELELYLVDFKKGVEFKTYAANGLPHARVVAIETDREFGLSVLQRVDEELKRRGERFRGAGAQSVSDFRAKTGEVVPRTLLIVDEFQELFTEDDRIAQEASLLLDRLVRQGRAFGVHVILGSQTLGGAYSLNRTTMAQMNVRIALQCDEQDSYIILSEDNAAARLLERPGEAVYNDAGGRVEGNSVFQIVWLPSGKRDEAAAVAGELARSRGVDVAGAVVFEGNAPADVGANARLAADGPVAGVGDPVSLQLGEPTAIAPPLAVVLRRRGGSNVLMVGQREETANRLLVASAVSFAVERREDEGASLYVLDGTPDDLLDEASLRRVAPGLRVNVRVCDPRGLETVLAEIGAELDRREELGLVSESPVLVLVNGLQRFRDLRKSEDFSFSMSDDEGGEKADRLFARVLERGPEFGVHVVVWCDSNTSLERSFDRRTLREFDQRVLFQMSAMDSTALIDSPLASRLGPNRAILAQEEDASIRAFRPYGDAPAGWLAGHMRDGGEG